MVGTTATGAATLAATRAPTKTERDVHTDARTARAETGATAAPMKAMVGRRPGGGNGDVCVWGGEGREVEGDVRGGGERKAAAR